MASRATVKAGIAPASNASLSQRWIRLFKESALFLVLLVVLYLLLALVSYNPADPGWSHAGMANAHTANQGGRVGAWLADFSLSVIGIMAFAPPLLLATWTWQWARLSGAAKPTTSVFDPWIRGVGTVLLILSGCALGHLHLAPGPQVMPGSGGGMLGSVIAEGLLPVIGKLATTSFALALFATGLTLATAVSWLRVFELTGAFTLMVIERSGEWALRFKDWRAGRQAKEVRVDLREARKKEPRREPPRIETFVAPIEKSDRAEREIQIPLFQNLSDGSLPPLALLTDPKPHGKGYSPEALEALSRQVEVKLKDFKVDVQVVGVYPGPVITRFELQPAPGVRASQISSLDKDIARGLSVVSVRVVEVIPGKSVVGLEIPNTNREIVFLKEILGSREYDKASSPLTLAMGKDIGGRPIVADVQKMPHVLVAGTTGSGKSVALNAMILSLLYKATADQVRIIMIDPKMLELSVYDGIPHLLCPVVTDMKEAANALRWCVAEMERRYKLMAAVGVRNLAGFNRKINDAQALGQPILDPLFNPAQALEYDQPAPLGPLPNLVVVIDEFADMMMIVGKKVEELIARLAQKARAAGIHLILATQRPSVDVITGLIKANIPTRVAFQVSSKIDSRTILDQSGAEALLGHGDMLYLPPGTGMPERVHGAFVDDDEVHAVVAWLKENSSPPEYLDSVLEERQELADGRVIGETGLPESAASADGIDELYDMAVKIVTESRRASISSVQRRLKIGYNRAARMIEEMENSGIVSAPNHQGNREVLAAAPPEY